MRSPRRLCTQVQYYLYPARTLIYIALRNEVRAWLSSQRMGRKGLEGDWTRACNLSLHLRQGTSFKGINSTHLYQRILLPPKLPSCSPEDPEECSHISARLAETYIYEAMLPAHVLGPACVHVLLVTFDFLGDPCGECMSVPLSL
jgi:hypothetical protein